MIDRKNKNKYQNESEKLVSEKWKTKLFSGVQWPQEKFLSDYIPFETYLILNIISISTNRTNELLAVIMVHYSWYTHHICYKVGPSTFFSAKQFEVFDVELLAVQDCQRRTIAFYSDVVCSWASADIPSMPHRAARLHHFPADRIFAGTLQKKNLLVVGLCNCIATRCFCDSKGYWSMTVVDW